MIMDRKRFRRSGVAAGVVVSRKKQSMIDEFPDEILIHILSFLPLKEAAVTCAVSSRWRYLWAYRPRLDFNFSFYAKPTAKQCRMLADILGNDCIRYLSAGDALAEQMPHYAKWVDRVISLNQPRCFALDEFSISSPLSDDYARFIDGWLMFALSGGVKRLELDFKDTLSGPPHPKFYTFPTNKLLARCSLQRCNANNRFGVAGGLTLLKSLCLKSVYIDGASLQLLLSECPALESTVLHELRGLEQLQLHLPSSRLNHLEFCDCPKLDSVKIFDTPLVSFTLKPLVDDCILQELPKLVELAVGLGGTRRVQTLSNLPSSSGVFSHLKRLKIEDGMKKVWAYKRMMTAAASWRLNNLEELDITIIESNRDMDLNLVPYTDLVEQAPSLQKLVMRVLCPGLCRNEGNIVGLEEARIQGHRRCSKQLKVLEFYGYYGRVEYNAFIWYLIENAVSLETIVIDPSYQPADYKGIRHGWKGYTEARISAVKEFAMKLPPRVKLMFAD